MQHRVNIDEGGNIHVFVDSPETTLVIPTGQKFESLTLQWLFSRNCRDGDPWEEDVADRMTRSDSTIPFSSEFALLIPFPFGSFAL